jgi:hypothetical protein
VIISGCWADKEETMLMAHAMARPRIFRHIWTNLLLAGDFLNGAEQPYP